METVRREYVYTHVGPQRPVFLPEFTRFRPTGYSEVNSSSRCERKVWFELDCGGGEAGVMVTYDPQEAIDANKARWEVASPCGVYGVTGMRVLVRSLVHPVVLRVCWKVDDRC